MNDRDKISVGRRTLIKTVAGGSLLGLAGCQTGEPDTEAPDNDNDDGDSGDDATETATEAGQDTYTIGMVDSLSGSLSAFGQRNQRGMEIALEDINAVGVKGGELELSTEDDQSTSQGGVSAAQSLVNQEEVPLLVGTVGSGVSTAIHESVVQNTDVVQISQNSTSPNLTNYPDLLRTAPTGTTQAAALRSLIDDDGNGSVAVAWINNDYGQSISEAFVDNYEGDVLYNEAHDQGQASYSNVISSMANTDADAWVFITYQPEFATMSQEAYDLGVTDQADWYGADSVKGPKVLDGAPEGSLDGMQIVAPSVALDQENYKAFAEEFESRHDTEPTSWSAFTYDAIVISALAVEAADEFTGPAIAEVVRDITRPEGEQVTSDEDARAILADGGSPSDVDYQGVSGPIDLDENGDPVGLLQVFTVENHEYVSTDFIEG